jgi:hypothetical protein
VEHDQIQLHQQPLSHAMQFSASARADENGTNVIAAAATAVATALRNLRLRNIIPTS